MGCAWRVEAKKTKWNDVVMFTTAVCENLCVLDGKANILRLEEADAMYIDWKPKGVVASRLSKERDGKPKLYTPGRVVRWSPLFEIPRAFVLCGEASWTFELRWVYIAVRLRQNPGSGSA